MMYEVHQREYVKSCENLYIYSTKVSTAVGNLQDLKVKDSVSGRTEDYLWVRNSRSSM